MATFERLVSFRFLTFSHDQSQCKMSITAEANYPMLRENIVSKVKH